MIQIPRITNGDVFLIVNRNSMSKALRDAMIFHLSAGTNMLHRQPHRKSMRQLSELKSISASPLATYRSADHNLERRTSLIRILGDRKQRRSALAQALATSVPARKRLDQHGMMQRMVVLHKKSNWLAANQTSIVFLQLRSAIRMVVMDIAIAATGRSSPIEISGKKYRSC